MNDYDRMRQRHHDGMCGGDCPECDVRRRRENEEYNWRLAQEEAAAEEYNREPNPDLDDAR